MIRRFIKYVANFPNYIQTTHAAKVASLVPQERKFHKFFDSSENKSLKILFLISGYNGLSQRLHRELVNRGHEVSVELAIDDYTMSQAVVSYQPNLILAPMLKKAIPSEIWTNIKCLILHPGIMGDRGPSSIDWAIHNQETTWGVTVLQANEEMDAGDIWATREFPLGLNTKSQVYNQEATEAGIEIMLEAVEKFQDRNFVPDPLDYSKPEVKGTLRLAMKQSDRKIEWSSHTTLEILRKIHMSDNQPGVLADICDNRYFLYDAHLESTRFDGKPGEVIGQRDGAVLVKTIDGAIWVGHMRPTHKDRPNIKLKSAMVLGNRLKDVSNIHPNSTLVPHTYQEISYQKAGPVGILTFNFYNGAMSTPQCHRLLHAFNYAKSQDTNVLILRGNSNFFSNGIHLNVMEASPDPSQEAWANIIAMNDVVKAIFDVKNQITIAAIEGNAGAGGVALALACDRVVAREGSVLNMHYKNMGLFGSEYHTYSMPRRVGKDRSRKILGDALPMLGFEAYKINMVDYILPNNRARFFDDALKIALKYAAVKNFDVAIQQKLGARYFDEKIKPLEAYRAEELAQMRLNMFTNNLGFHEKRQQFVLKLKPEKTAENIAIHRRASLPMGQIINGRNIADDMLEEVREKVENLRVSFEILPHLAIIRIGDNPASISYIRQKRKACEKVGIFSSEYIFGEDQEFKALEKIKELNEDPNVNGILIQLPIPEKMFSVSDVNELISPEKDVDGFNAKNFGGMALGLKNTLTPCTARGIIKILEKYDKELYGKHTVVVGKSNIVGKPLTNLILEKSHSTITVCHKETQDLINFIKQADVLIVAAGVPNLIKEDMVKSNSIVIDVGITRVEDPSKKSGYRLVGDVDFENVRKKVKLITPVPGGVGPLTVASLIQNTYEAFKMQNENLLEERRKKSIRIA